MLASGMLQSFFQSVGLDGKNLLAALIPLCLVLGHKGQALKGTGECGFLLFQGKVGSGVKLLFFGDKATHPPSLTDNPVQIQFRIEDARLEIFLLFQNGAIFRNDAVSAKHQILGGFTLRGGGVDIATQQPCRDGFHQKFPVLVLSHRLIGGGKIHKHIGSRQCMGGGGGIGCPDILTDFASHTQLRHGITL